MKHRTILITGATGFLGSYITRELFEAGFHLKLLIRNSAHEQAKEKISDVFPPVETTGAVCDTLSDRIEIIEGDISQKYLGMNAQNYSRLSDTVDEVFHCAAATKFYHGSDTSLVQTNVYGTEHLAWFCIFHKMKRFHYMSTAYVAGTRSDTVFEYELEKNQTFNNHYEKSNTRDLLVRTRTQHILHCRGLLKSFGVTVPSCSAGAFRQRVTEHITADLAPALTPLVRVLTTIEEQIREFDKTLAKLAESNYPATRQLRQVRGVGPVCSLAFVLTVADPNRFLRSRSIGPWLGLVPKRRASGQSDPQLRITKRGDGYLRRLLVTSAQYILGPFGKD